MIFKKQQKAQRPQGRRAFLAKGLAALLVGPSAWIPKQAQAAASELQVKSAFILKFLSFCRWPSGFSTSNYIIGVVGSDPIRSTLELAAKAQSTQERKVTVKSFANVSAIQPCHCLFVGKNMLSQLDAINKLAIQKTMLTVSDTDGFANRGGMIQLVIEGGKIRFDVNLKTAFAAKLKISSKLLRLARNVIKP